MDLGSVKKVSPNKQLFKKIFAIVFSVIVIFVSYLSISTANKKNTETIEVIRVRAEDGLPALKSITEKDVETYQLIKKEYTEEMVLAKDLPNILNKISKYYMRRNAVLYYDQITDKNHKKNEWLYQLDPDLEVLTLPYNSLEVGGTILLPGDWIRVRFSYEAEDDASSTEQKQSNLDSSVSVNRNGKTIVTDILFDQIVVKDMINSNGNSIYEIYQEVAQLNEEEKQKKIQSEEFFKKIQPKSLLLAGTKKQMTHYATYKNVNAKSLLITILSRVNNTNMMEQVNDARSEVQQPWGEKSQIN